MTPRARAIITTPATGQAVQGPTGGPLTLMLRGDQTGGALTVLVNQVSPGHGPPLHVHERENESFYVIEGEFRFRLGDEISRVGAGSFVFVPRGIEHAWQNAGAAPARILVMFSPAGMEAFFDGLAALGDEEGDAQRFRAVADRVGMRITGPTLAESHPV